jgi:small subunit ribosomal protein S17e
VTILGKVRIGKVKSVSNELVDKYPTVFSTEFEANKKLVYEHTDIRSKHLNNRVAGYITRLQVSQKKREEALKLEEAEIASKEAEAQVPAMEMATEETPAEAPQGETAAAPTEEAKTQGEGVETPAEAKEKVSGKEVPTEKDATKGKAE